MLRSMTGFARAERTTAAGLLAWEIRSVNHRYLEVGLRLPEDLRASEADYRRAIGAVARRGKVDASFYVRSGAAAGRELTLDEDLLDRLIENASAVRRRLGAEAASTPWISCAGPASSRKPNATPRRSRPRRRNCSPRRSPPSRLRAQAKASGSPRCSPRAPRSCSASWTRSQPACPRSSRASARELQERIAALAVEVNPERLEQEVAILVQKMDVAEELDRLRSHVEELNTLIGLGRGGRPQARFPDAGIQPRGEHALIEVAGRRDDAQGGRAQGADRADAGADPECGISSRDVQIALISPTTTRLSSIWALLQQVAWASHVLSSRLPFAASAVVVAAVPAAVPLAPQLELP